MNQFSISQLSQFSGIKAHTIRIWEQRYNALKPDRSEGNTRYYDNQQLRRLLNIASLLDSGYKVSELCVMPDRKLYELVNKATAGQTEEEPYGYFISQLVAAGMAYDEAHFDKILSHSLLKFGIKQAYTRIVCPMLQRVGMLWSSDSIRPGQEHFISNLIRQKLCTVIDSLPPPKSEDLWILFLPENEFHETGLLFAQFMLRLEGRRTLYLGANIPDESLAQAIKESGANKLFLFLVHFDEADEVQEYLERLARTKGVDTLCVAGNMKLLGGLKEKRFTKLGSVLELEEFLKTGSV